MWIAQTEPKEEEKKSLATATKLKNGRVKVNKWRFCVLVCKNAIEHEKILNLIEFEFVRAENGASVLISAQTEEWTKNAK